MKSGAQSKSDRDGLRRLELASSGLKQAPATRPQSSTTKTPSSTHTMPQKPLAGDHTSMHQYQTPPRPTDGYKREPLQYQGPPPFGSMQPTQYPQAGIQKSSLSSSNVSLAMPTPLFPAFAGLPKALSEGTGKYKWLEYLELEKDPTLVYRVTNRYQTITRIDFYKQWSLEELRFGDYEKGRKYGPVEAPRREPTAPLPSAPAPAIRHPVARTAPTPASVSRQVSSPVYRHPAPPAHHAGVECCRCDRHFSKTSAMIQHLESGGCPDGPNEYEFYSTVAKHQNWCQFIHTADRCNMLISASWSNYYPFFCPCCDRECALLAGLMSHIEGSSCGQDLSSEPISNLLGWIRNKI